MVALAPDVPSAFLLIPLPFVYAAMRAIEWRWWVSGIRIGEVRFTSDLRNGAFIGLYWKVIGWSALLMVVLGAWIGDRGCDRIRECRREPPGGAEVPWRRSSFRF